MNVHEYQAKQLLKSYGLAVPRGGVAATAAEAQAIARALGGTRWVVKAQIHAGGRGPAGGIKIVHSVDDVEMIADLMLGAELTTAQTAPQGQKVSRVYIEQGYDIVRRFYLALLVDADKACVTLLVSPESGNEGIEEIATQAPEKVLRIALDPEAGLQTEQARQLADSVDLSGPQAETLVRYLQALYELFVSLDASLVEISPLVVSDSGELLVLDAKLSFDDNALFRHPTVQALQDLESRHPTELAAAQQGLNYIELDGDIGTLVSGAGLAMATLDAIVEVGGRAANFLDVPPVARQAQVAGAVQLLLGDSRLKSILINVFGGGIMQCNTVADGLVAALRQSRPKTPLVVRLDGINADIGKKALLASGFEVTFADDLADAAQKAVQAATSAAAAPSLLKKLFGREKH